MAKTGGSLRGGGNSGISAKFKAAADNINIQEIEGSQKEYSKIKAEIDSKFNERYNKLVEKEGKEAADKLLLDNAEKIATRAEATKERLIDAIKRRQFEESKPPTNNEVFKKQRQTQIAIYNRIISELKPSLYNDKAQLEWVASNVGK